MYYKNELFAYPVHICYIHFQGNETTMNIVETKRNKNDFCLFFQMPETFFCNTDTPTCA